MKRIKVLDTLKPEHLRDFNWDVVSVDVETYDETGGDEAANYDKIALEMIQLCDGNITIGIYLKDNPELLGILNFITEQLKGKTVVAHNIPFELSVFAKYGMDTSEWLLFDTMVGDHLINEHRRHGLKFLAENILGASEVMDYETARAFGLHSDEFFNYACNDVEWCYELYILQKAYISNNNMEKLFYKIEMPFQRCLTEMRVTGVVLDIDLLKQLNQQYQQITTELKNNMLSLLGITDRQKTLFNESLEHELNFDSPHVLSDILFGKLGLEVIETTPGGQASVGKITLDKYKDIPIVKLLSDYKKYKKRIAAFTDPLQSYVDRDGKVRPDFIDIGTKTGRLSCRNPNLQQLPKGEKGKQDIRDCFKVPDGYTMITCDYSGQELRVLAQLTQEPALIDIFNKGKDMHLSTANDFFNLNIPEEELYENHPKFNEHKKVYDNERNKAKVINFGMAYGKGAYGFSKDFNISEQEAQEILDKYFAALPKVKQCIEQTHRQVKENGYCTTMAGRRRRFLKEDGKYPKKAFRESFNFLIQGFSADMIRKAMVLVHKEKALHPEWNLQAIMTVHDEAVYQVKTEYVNEACALIKQQFEGAVKFDFPVVADVKTGKHYGEAK